MEQLSPADQAYYNLASVIVDVTEGGGVDDVCLNTLVRLQESMIAWKECEFTSQAYDRGDLVPLPKNKEHAEAMVKVGLFYLNQQESKG
jgi:hypothetical protein